jgi:signal peptidase II
VTFFSKIGPFLVGLVIFLIDFAVKGWANATLPRMSESSPFYPYGGIGIFKNFLGVEFSLSLATNRGAAWGMGADHQMPLLYLRILLLVGLIIWLLFYNTHRHLRYPFALVVAGAIGNVVDTFIYGHVIDMFHFVLWGYDFPVFNVADSAIFIGIAWMFLQSYTKRP